MKLVKIGALALMFGLSSSVLYAQWSPPPSGTAPTCPTGSQGCDAPINVGNSPQIKDGNLTVNAAGSWATGFWVPYGNIGFGLNAGASNAPVRPFDTTGYAGITMPTTQSRLIMGKRNDSPTRPGIIASDNWNLRLGFGDSFTAPDGGAFTEILNINQNGITVYGNITANQFCVTGQPTCIGGTNMVFGSGTVNRVPKWTPNTQTLGDSQIYDDGTNVGIGTVSPGHKLDVAGNNVTLRVLSGAPAVETTIFSGLSGGLNRSTIFTTGSMISFGAGGGTRMSVLDTGNVGINTTAPGERLEVNGNIKLTSGVGAYGAGRVQAFSGGDVIGYTMNSTSRVWDLISIVSTPTDYFAIRDNTAGANRLTIDQSGNTGIDITPAWKLDVAGDVNTNGCYRVNGICRLNASTQIVTGNGTQNRITKWTTSSTIGDGTLNDNGDYIEMPNEWRVARTGAWGADFFEIHKASPASPWPGGAVNGNYGGLAAGHGYFYEGLQSGGSSGMEAGAGQLYVSGISMLMGNVGVGTASPGASTMLNVVGRGLFTGGAYDPGDGTAAGVSISFDGAAGHIETVRTGVTSFPLELQHYNNLGVGTAAPQYKLDVTAPANTWKAIFQGSDGYITLGPANASWAHIYTDRPNFIFNRPVYSIEPSGGAGAGFSSYNTADLSLQTNGTERMRILNASGYVGVGTAAADKKFQVNGSMGQLNRDWFYSQNGAGVYDWAFGADPSGAYGGTPGYFNLLMYNGGWLTTIVANKSGNVGIGFAPLDPYKLDVNGTVRAGAFVYGSDASLKQNVKTIPNALEQILRLRGVTFNWKNDGTPSLGVVAQEVEQVYPELVVTDTNGVKGVHYGNLVGPLIEAVKELKAENDELRTRIERLEEKN